MNYTCKGRYIINNKPVGFILQDESGKEYKIRAKHLVDAMKAGDIILTNVTFNENGKLMLISSSNTKNNTVKKMTKSLEDVRALKFLETLVLLVGKVNERYRITDFGYEINSKSKYYYFCIAKPEFDNYVFSIEDNLKTSKIVASTPDYIYETFDMYEAIDTIEDSLYLRKEYCEYGKSVLRDTALLDYNNTISIDREFGLDKFKGLNIVTSGNNVLLMDVDSVENGVLKIPRFITAINSSIFSGVNNIKQIKCESTILAKNVSDALKINGIDNVEVTIGS
ncbi:MAG: hypothetical protein IJ593_07055 [Lachnospiraceae bacterium]|nr:hypothetical protein [Lachnospiraceae bacterium]